MKKTIIALTLVVAIAIALSITIPTFAAAPVNPDTTTITGNVQAAIDVSAPADFSMDLTPGLTTTASKTVAVKCNKDGWDLTASASTGYMVTGGTPLQKALYVEDYNNALQPLTSPVQLADAVDKTGGTAENIAADFSQETTWDDAYGTYTILVTFTGTTH